MTHDVLLHRGPEELLTAISAFIEDGLAAGEPTLALFPGETLERLRARIADSEGVRLEDMAVVGRNPARILPLLQTFAEDHQGRPIRVVEQPVWPGRSEAELSEVIQHEALVNVACAGTAARIMCAYDVDSVDQRVLTAAQRAHPRLVSPGRRPRNTPDYAAPSEIQATGRFANSIDHPRSSVDEIPVTLDLGRLRRRVASSRVTAGLPEPRRADLVLAVNEAATNALEHGEEPRVARLWRAEDAVVAEVIARGHIDDPLAGRRRPRATAERGRGLWIVNQLCDLVQLRHEGCTTRLQLHVRTG